MFFVQHQCLWFQTNKFKNIKFSQEGGCNKTFFFNEPVFAKCESYRFLALSGQIWVDVQKTL